MRVAGLEAAAEARHRPPDQRRRVQLVPQDPLDSLNPRRRAGVPGHAIGDVAELCHALDGLPLAIELAAAWLPAVGFEGLRERPDMRLDAGPGVADRAGRHATLRSIIAWSYELLEPDVQRLFRLLAVVPDGFDLDVVEAVCLREGVPRPARVAATLVDCSMLVADRGDGSGVRYRMLDSIRAFGREQLDERGETAIAGGALAAWGMRFVERARDGLSTPEEPAWHRRTVAALPILRAARRHLLERRDLSGLARLSAGLDDFSLWGEQSEVWSWALETAELPGLADLPEASLSLAAAARGAWRLGRQDLAGDLARRARGAARDDLGRAAANGVAGVVALFGGQHDEAVRLLRGAARTSPPGLTRAAMFATAALAAGYAGQSSEANELLTEAEELATDAGAPTGRAYAAYVRGELTAPTAPERAIVHLEAAIELARASGASFVEGVARVTLASCATRTGQPETARAAYRDAILYWPRTGSWTQAWTTLRNAAELLAGEGQLHPALTILVAGDTDPAAPALAADAAARLSRRPREIRTRLSAAVAERLAEAAPMLSRAEVVTDALDALAER
ncbi:MAG: hypothetical protein ACRD0K_17400 [Egibacteraceae bacterium]